MNSSKPIIFYDIASGPPVTSFAPNPWKTRYALNFKRVNYKTSWVELPDVATTRRDKLKVPPVRAHLDGSEFYTMPVIHDLFTGQKIGDTFDIALYLDKTYPKSGGQLFPPLTEGLMRAWNAKCDEIFSGANNTFGSVALLYAHGLPFNPETAEQSKAEFVARVPRVKSWDDFNLVGEAREKALGGFKALLEELSNYFRKRGEGPFLDGLTPTYADFICGGWLKNLSICLPEWDEVKRWQDGLWEKLHVALEDYAEVK